MSRLIREYQVFSDCLLQPPSQRHIDRSLSYPVATHNAADHLSYSCSQCPQATSRHRIKRSYASQLLLPPVLTDSPVHDIAKFPERTAAKPINALNDRARFRSFDRYPVTKLLELFIVQKIARLSKASGIVVSAVNPAFCRSDLNREAGMFVGAILA